MASSAVPRGGALLVLSLVVLAASSLAAVVTHRLMLERERAWRPAWALQQAQAAGHGGLMWALARLEDPRPLEDDCRPAAGSVAGPSMGPGLASFAQRVARPGGAVTCAIALESAAGLGGWHCNCSAAQPRPPPILPAHQAQLALDFSGTAGMLTLSASVTVLPPGANHPVRWQESVQLRADATQTWRPVVGSWTDGR